MTSGKSAGGVRPVALAGMMGCGKSVTGRCLAGMLGREFVDTDRLLESRAGCSIPELFARDGETAFRELERGLIGEIETWGPVVVALGGGMFVGETHVERLRGAAFTVWLRARPETLLARLDTGERATRPLLDGPDPLGRLTTLLETRVSWYERAHAVIDVDRLTIEETARAIVERLRAGAR